jgi:hypothetical protein
MGNETESKNGDGFVMKEKPAEPPQHPESVDFATFIFSLATGAFIGLGLTPDPSTGKTEIHLPMAQQNIELLVLLREKTKGNLSVDESKLLEGLLAEAQLRFVEVSAKKR